MNDLDHDLHHEVDQSTYEALLRRATQASGGSFRITKELGPYSVQELVNFIHDFRGNTRGLDLPQGI